MWKYKVIDCLLENLERSMNTPEHLQETEENRFKVKPMGLVTYKQNGKTRCILTYGWKRRK